MEHKSYLSAVLAIGLIIVAVVLAINLGTLKNEPNAEENKLTVTGYAEMSVMPDKAVMYITIETTEKSAIDSQKKNSDISSAVTSALKKAGILETDIETDSFSLYPRYEWNENTKKSDLVGYTASHTLKVTTTSINEIGDFLDKAILAGANNIDRVVFGLTKQKEKQVSQQLLGIAADNAGEKAASLAQGLNVHVGEVIGISESNYNIQPYNYYNVRNSDMASSGAELKTTIAPKNVETTAYITVVYEI